MGVGELKGTFETTKKIKSFFRFILTLVLLGVA